MLTVYQNIPLSILNTMGVEGQAHAAVIWDTPNDLREFFRGESYAGLNGNVKQIGEGSNLLFVNNRFDGTLLLCNNHDITSRHAGYIEILTIGAGMKLDDLVKACVSRNLWGLENLGLIPGTVGAAAVQNVGAYGVEFGSMVEKVECFDRTTGDIIEIPVDKIKYGYRDSIFKHEPARDRFIITNVTIKLSTLPSPNLSYGNLSARIGQNPTLCAIYDAVCDTRRGKLPDVNETGSAGSFFKNPVITAEVLEKVVNFADTLGITRETIPVFPANLPDGTQGYKLSAAWLIDRSGWKGITKGNVGTWPTQPLVIVNITGNATGHEVADLAKCIADDIETKWNVRLVPEVEYIY